ncbi:MAG TPA: type II secretion system ATPase GspE, partial [Lysobacter sp.]|nr:type II secretion system ATPase GspE [Lysobacter sp.]
LATQREVHPRVALRSEIDDLIERWFGQGRSAMGAIVETAEGEGSGGDLDDVEHLRDLASEAPVIRLVNLVIQRAVELRSSDIHIEPFENRLKVRYRIDGVLNEGESPPANLTAAVISRVKIMAKLNIAERRLPQDGRIMLRVQGKELDLRVSTMPTSHGESVVMRLLDRETVVFDFHKLGFTDHFLPQFQHVLDQPHGILLVTGPTGSGKTTTLYTALSKLNTPDVKIITVEDPVEYQIEGINQIQAKPQIGLDFAHALRSIVRQDPDIIMIGEMRDLETARIAIQSALTGHLVLSTLHTNNAAGGITRLLDMGVEDYLLTSTINGILAQRLVRRLEPTHAERYPASPEEIDKFGLRRYQPQGEICLYRPSASAIAPTGYLGRTTIMEFLVMNDELRRAVMRHAGMGEIEQIARQSGMRTMYEDGIVKALAGETTIEEVLRVTEDA